MGQTEIDPRHTLMLERIARSLKEEDESNAEMWRDKGDAESSKAIAELCRLADALVRARGFPIEYGELEFPGLPRS